MFELQSVALIERDTNNDILWVWSYPTIEESFRELVMGRCTLDKDDDTSIEYCYCHYQQTWCYLSNFKCEDNPKLPKLCHINNLLYSFILNQQPNSDLVAQDFIGPFFLITTQKGKAVWVTACCLVLLTKDFNPEKYRVFSGLLWYYYSNSGSPTSILTPYLSVFTKGSCVNPIADDDDESFAVKSFDIRMAYIACPLRDVVQMFGIESIYIYTALLLKKRVVVYAPDVNDVLKVTRTLPLFVWHRQNWNIIFPHVELTDMELADLTSHGTYVAGFTDATIEARTELYDLFINVPANAISVAPHSKDSFILGKLHKDIAMHLMECVEDATMNDQKVIKELSLKTRELIMKVQGLSDEADGSLTLDSLREKKLTPALETFLYNLASAEGLTQL